MAIQNTLALFKPDLVASGKQDEVQAIIESNGLTVVRKETITLDRDRAGSFYAEHEGKPFFNSLVDFMTSGPIVALILSGENAIKKWRSIMGPTNVDVARKEAPESIRALFAESTTRNAVHGSDSEESAKREISFYFPEFKHSVPTESEVRQFINDKLSPLLQTALTEMAKIRPDDPIKWLADYLIANNPNSPQVEE
ncbi:hypothetical protein P9112_007702 [Eukaryota sp. TZLM1-RC]